MPRATRPKLPQNDPLQGYVEYMLDHVDAVYSMLWFLIISILLLAATFAFFGIQRWFERRDLQGWRDEVRNLLAVIKGWTVVNRSSSERAVIEVGEKIDRVPEATAAKVVERVEELKSSDSGYVKVYPLKTVPNPPPPEPGPESAPTSAPE